MLRKLRRRFVAVNMLILSTILFGILAGVYILMTRAETEASQQQLRRAMQTWYRPDAPEAASYRMLWVELDSQKQLQHLFDRSGGSNATDALSEAAARAVDSGKKTDTLTLAGVSYRYMYQKTERGWRLVLLDRAIELDTLRRMRLNFALIGAGGLLVTFCMSLLLARWAIRPIASAWETQRNFVADASHELKTPLTVIATNTELVLANPEVSIQSQVKWLDYIKEETARMAGLVANLLYIAKVDAGEIKAVRMDVNLSALAEEYCMNREVEVFEAGRVFRYEVEPEVHLSADGEKLQKLLGILMDNALQYSNDGGEIGVRLVRDRLGRACLIVTNTGEAIPNESLPRVFDRFYRVDRSRARNTGGYGLGLSIAKSIAEMHEGTITVHSEPNGVTAFVVLLP